MDRHGVRYIFEHRLLPQWFYDDAAQFVGMLLHDKEIIYKVISDIFEKEGISNPYEKEAFKLEPIRLTDNILMLKISFPEPEEEPLCYCSFLLFDEDFEKTGYFCIEKGNAAGDDIPFVCGWNKEGAHINYGHCNLNDESGLLRCMELFAHNTLSEKITE